MEWGCGDAVMLDGRRRAAGGDALYSQQKESEETNGH